MNNSLIPKAAFVHPIVWLGVALLAIGVHAQTFPKATGVATPGLQRTMASIQPEKTFNLGGHPDWMALTSDAVWVSSSSTNQVTRIDARSNEVSGFVAIAKPCSGLTVAFGSLWVPSCGDHNLARVDLQTRKIVATIPAAAADSEGGITSGAGSIWMVTAPKGKLARIDPATNSIQSTVPIPPHSYAPAFADGSVWITSTGNDLLTRVDPASNKVVSTTGIGRQPRFLTVGAGSVWILNQGDGTISRVDTKNGKLMATINAGLSGQGGEIAFGEGSVWATLFGFPITRIDPATNHIVAQWKGKGGDSIRAGLGSIWLTDLYGGLLWRIHPAQP